MNGFKIVINFDDKNSRVYFVSYLHKYNITSIPIL